MGFKVKKSIHYPLRPFLETFQSLQITQFSIMAWRVASLSTLKTPPHFSRALCQKKEKRIRKDVIEKLIMKIINIVAYGSTSDQFQRNIDSDFEPIFKYN